MDEITILMAGFGTALLGVIQLLQKNITKTGDMQQKKNEQILTLSTEVVTLRDERDNARELARKHKQRTRYLQTKLKRNKKYYAKLMKAIQKNCEKETLNKIKEDISSS